MRLDFEMFQIAGPGNTNELIVGTTAYTHCTRDTLIITVMIHNQLTKMAYNLNVPTYSAAG